MRPLGEPRLMNTIHGQWNDSPDAVTLIDAHHHLWDLRRGKHPWLCGAEEKPFFMAITGRSREITCRRITGATPPATMC
jgi:hypothetical protein